MRTGDGRSGGGRGREREERRQTTDKRIERLVHVQQPKNGLYPEHASDFGVSEMKHFNRRPLGPCGTELLSTLRGFRLRAPFDRFSSSALVAASAVAVDNLHR